MVAFGKTVETIARMLLDRSTLHIYLDEKDNRTNEHLLLKPNGFTEPTVIKDFPVLEALYARYPMVLVSNFYGNVESVLADFDLRRYFRDIIESAVVGVRKPDPKIFQLGVDALGLKPEEVLVIGDSYKKDIVPAESIGCHVAWIKGKGWTADEDAQMHP